MITDLNCPAQTECGLCTAKNHTEVKHQAKDPHTGLIAPSNFHLKEQHFDQTDLCQPLSDLFLIYALNSLADYRRSAPIPPVK